MAETLTLNDQEEETTSRAMDAEIRIITAILRKLAEVEPPARKRIMAYLHDRYLGEQP